MKNLDTTTEAVDHLIGLPFGQLGFFNSMFTHSAYWKFVSVDKKSHFVECPLINPIIFTFYLS